MSKHGARTGTLKGYMLAVLKDVEEFLDDQSDVVDGDYGELRPNRAMSLLNELRVVISAVGDRTAVPHDQREPELASDDVGRESMVSHMLRPIRGCATDEQYQESFRRCLCALQLAGDAIRKAALASPGTPSEPQRFDGEKDLEQFRKEHPE